MKKQQLNQQPEDGVPSATLPVTEKKETSTPVVSGQSQRDGNSKPESVNDFRPTAPGNSPGVGHSFAEHKFNPQSEEIGSAPAVPQSTTANSDDFRPTAPGHSPGGGHSKENHVVKPNA